MKWINKFFLSLILNSSQTILYFVFILTLILVFFMLLFLIMVIVEFYSWKLLFKSMIWLIISIIVVIILSIDCLTLIAFIYITNYYLKLKFRKINDSIMSLVNLNKHNPMETIKSALIQHNNLCLEIHNHNKITKRLYFYIIFNVMPTNLIVLHQYLFEDIKFYVQIVYLLIITMQLLAIFVFQYNFASLSTSIHKSSKILSRLQWKLNGCPFRMRTKIQLLIYFERLSSDRKIGFSIGSLAVMTFPLFSKVYIFYD